MATASAITACTALRIEREEMIRMMYQEHSLSEMYLKFLLVRSMRAQADLVDQLFNSSEKRLARILLLMAEFGEPGEPEGFIPPITQETLAEMVGTTRSRVSFFMNSFRKLGLIEYNYRNRIRVRGTSGFGHSTCSIKTAIFAQRIEKVKLADFTTLCCRRPLRSWSDARNLHFGNAPPGLPYQPASNWS
jgi:hypothetical protein